MSGSNVWKLRLTTEGADQLIRDLREVASSSEAGTRALDTFLKSQPQLATGSERAEQALRRNIDAMKGMRGELGLISSALDGATSSLGSFGAALRSPQAAVAALTAGLISGVVAVAQLGDQYTTTMNRLAAATGSISAARDVYAQLQAVVRQTGASISESADAFVRFSVAARSIGATNEQIVQITRTIQQAGIVAGVSAQESSSAVLQLGQALASGRLQGDELRAILEAMPTLAEALANQLGVSIGQLREMGSQGQLTSDRVFQALLRASEGINQQFEQLTPTMGRAFGVLGQEMLAFVQRLNEAVDLSGRIARAAQAAATAVASVAALTPAQGAASDEAAAIGRRDRLQTELARLSGEPGYYAQPRRGTTSRALQEAAAQATPNDQRIAELRAQIEAEDRIIAEARERRARHAAEDDEKRQAEEASAFARRAAAQRERDRLQLEEYRRSNKSREDLQREHNERLALIDRNAANGAINLAERDRLRAASARELADGIKQLENAQRGQVETDQSLAEVMRVVNDIERDRQSLLREAETITRSVMTEQEKYAETQLRLNVLLEEGRITQETYNRALAAADPAVRAAQRASEQAAQRAQQSANAVETTIAGAFARAFEDGEDRGRTFWENLKRGARSFAATIASQLVFRMAIIPTVNAVGGALGFGNNLLATPNTPIGGALGGLFGGGSSGQTLTLTPDGSGGFSLGNISSATTVGRGIFGGGGLGSFFPGGGAFNTGWGFADGILNTPLWGGSSAVATSGIEAAATGGLVGDVVAGAGSSAFTIGQALGPAAAIGGGIYGAIQGFQRGGVGGVIGGLGGVTSALSGGAMLASSLLPALGALGPAGLIAGAVMAIVGSLLPGQKPSGKGQEAATELDSGDIWYAGLTGERFSQANRDQATQAVSKIGELSRTLSSALGGIQLGIDAAVGVTSSRGNGPGQLYLRVGEQKAEFENTDDGAQQLADAATKMLLKEFRERATGDMRGILWGSGDDVEKLQENLQWYDQVYKKLTDNAEASSAFAEQLEQVRAGWQEQIDRAVGLSLSIETLIAKRDEEIAAIQRQRDAQVAQINQTLDLREAMANGIPTFESLSQLLRAQLFQTRAQEIDAFRKQLEDLGVSADIVASQVARLQAVQSAEYWRNFGDVMGANDADTLDRLRRATGKGGEADLAAFDREAQQVMENLRRTLSQFAELSIEDVNKKLMEKEQALAAQRQALLDQQIEAQKRAGQTIRDYLNGLATTTGPGGVSATQAFTAAQEQFRTVLGQAQGGDQGAYGQLTSVAEQLRTAAQALYASGPQYQAIRQWIESTLGSLPYVPHMAAGGVVTGGIPGRDSVPAMLMPGEGVLSLRGMAALESLNRGGGMGVGEVQALRRDFQRLENTVATLLTNLTAVTAAVGEQTAANTGATVRVLREQTDAQRLAQAQPPLRGVA